MGLRRQLLFDGTPCRRRPADVSSTESPFAINRSLHVLLLNDTREQPMHNINYAVRFPFANTLAGVAQRFSDMHNSCLIRRARMAASSEAEHAVRWFHADDKRMRPGKCKKYVAGSKAKSRMLCDHFAASHDHETPIRPAGAVKSSYFRIPHCVLVYSTLYLAYLTMPWEPR
jgi:hypothetical protein